MRILSILLFALISQMSAAQSARLAYQKYSLTPNPASSDLAIRSKESGTLRIYSASGKLVFFGKKRPGVLELDVSKLDKGTYLVMLELSGEHHRQRLVIR